MGKVNRFFKKTAREIVAEITGRTINEEIVLEWSALNFDINARGESEAEKHSNRIKYIRLLRARDPVGYLIKCFEILNNFTLYKSQKKEIRKILNSDINALGSEIVELWVRQSGKTDRGVIDMNGELVFMPLIALDPWWQKRFPKVKRFANGFFMVIGGPKIDQSKIPFRRMRKIYRKRFFKEHLKFLGVAFDSNEKTYAEFSHGSEVRCVSAYQTTSNEGLTAHRIHLEESQDTSEFQIQKVFKPFLAATSGTFVYNGTAGIRDSYYRRKCDKGGENFYKHTVDKAIADNPDYGKFVLKYIEENGPNSLFVKTTIDLEWILKYGMLISPDLYIRIKADGQDGRPHYDPGEFTPGAARFGGIDLGKYLSGTVATAGENHEDHKRLVDILILEGTDYLDQLTIIIPWFKERGVEIICVDSTGTQDQFVDIIRPNFVFVQGIVYTAPRKFEMLKNFRMHLPSEKDEKSQEHKRLLRAGHDYINLFQKADRYRKKGSRIYVPDYPPGHPEWRRFEEEILNCETEVKGNIEVYHKPDPSNTEKGLEPIRDDTVDSMMNSLEASNYCERFMYRPTRYELAR